LRPKLDVYFVNLANVVATRSTCLRRQVGCVLVDERRHVLTTGYNGSPVGLPNCCDLGRCRREASASGVGLEGACDAVHAEQNALLQCANVDVIRTCYVTTSPCTWCTRLLLNTGCTRVVYLNAYADVDAARTFWAAGGRGPFVSLSELLGKGTNP